MQALARSFGILALGGSALFAQNTVTVDPDDALADPVISLGEWETDGDVEGWFATNATETVSGGSFESTSDDDAQLTLNPITEVIDTPSGSIVTVDVRMKRTENDGSDIQLFWGDASGGFSAARSVTLTGGEAPLDEDFHTYRFEIRNVNGSLQGLRIDGTRNIGTDLSYDFVRLSVDSSGPPIGPVVDPPKLLNTYISLGEFNTDGDQEGWAVNQINSALVSGGIFSGLTGGNDSQFILGGLSLDSATEDLAIMEIRLRKEEFETSRLDLFWADASGGFAGDRMVRLDGGVWPDDGGFHIVHLPVGDFLNGTVTAFRFDPAADFFEAKEVALDYVRIGSIAPDGDEDGLADSVETNTGTFVDRNDTGTDPANPDTDNDSFSDGVEVAFGTDPTDSADFPEPSITAYTRTPVSYVVDSPITPNMPTVANGTPTGFTVSPALPAGLSLDGSTGVISGTPTAVAAATDYTVTANFAGGLSNDFQLNLEVTNPGIVRYSINPAEYSVGMDIAANSPVLAGPFPESFEITPELPEDLFFSTFDGTISGFPSVVTPATDYTVTAKYNDYPDSVITLSIRTKAAPVLLGTDVEPLGSFVSLGEWDTDGDLEGWTFNNATGTVLDGALTYEATAPDPQMNRPGVLDVSQGTTLEIRMNISESVLTQIFWADDAGGLSEIRSFRLQPEFVIADGAFHTYQIGFDEVFSGEVTFFRIDPGTTAGVTADIDYIRMGAGTAVDVTPVITAFAYDQAFGEVTVTWTSTANTDYSIESSPNLRDWTELRDSLTGEAGSTTVIVGVTANDRFFRIVRQ